MITFGYSLCWQHYSPGNNIIPPPGLPFSSPLPRCYSTYLPSSTQNVFFQGFPLSITWTANFLLIFFSNKSIVFLSLSFHIKKKKVLKNPSKKMSKKSCQPNDPILRKISKAFFALTRYYQSFIPNYSAIAEPLT